MTNTNETIADIIAEMRALSNPISDGIIAINGRSIADRLEAAYNGKNTSASRNVREQRPDFRRNARKSEELPFVQALSKQIKKFAGDYPNASAKEGAVS